MNRYLPFFVCGLLVAGNAGHAQTACPEETLWEPYSEVCAPVRDVQTDFLPQVQKLTAVHSDAPVPAGGMAAGVAYAQEQLVARDSGRLHTRMFVYPDGLERDGALPAWLYTTATSRVDDGLELLAMYSEAQAAGYLGLYAWTCSPAFPCPNGDTARDWQWSRALPELSCSITQVVDQGGHAQKQLYYANHSDRLDNGSPPLWKSAVYLWNYCDAAWDLAWEHLYRQDKDDCSVPGATCAWWGPSVEIFGDAVYPQVGELGYEDSLLYHDGTWSVLAPPETQFRDPTNPTWGSLTPWQVFHVQPNRSYGVGNWVNDNDAPVIEGQEPLTTLEGESITIDTDNLTITDADIDPAYHVTYGLTVYGGDNYTVSGTTVSPDADFTGALRVPVSVNDGAAESATFEVTIDVVPANGVPIITAQAMLSTPEEIPLAISLAHFTVADSNSTYPDDFTLSVNDGTNYTRIGNTITPVVDFNGNLTVPVTVNDGSAESPVFNARVSVTAVNDRPVITGQKSIVTPADTPREIVLSDLTVDDPDNIYPTDFTLTVGDGTDYSVAGNTVTPAPGFTGSLMIPVTVNDGATDSAVFNLTVSVVAANDLPVITGQATLQTLEDQSIEITIGDLEIYYPNGNQADLTIIVHDGSFYTHVASTVTPSANYSGELIVSVSVSDGQVESGIYGLRIGVVPVNDAPSITGQLPVETLERTPVEITVGDLLITDPDNDNTELSISVLDGSGYVRAGNAITPEAGVVGALAVNVVASDGALESDVFSLVVQVLADTVPPPPPPASSGGGGTTSGWLLALLAGFGWRFAGKRKLVGPRGIEPRTCGLRVRCSA